jgi:hypothetical protein
MELLEEGACWCSRVSSSGVVHALLTGQGAHPSLFSLLIRHCWHLLFLRLCSKPCYHAVFSPTFYPG